MHDKYRSLDRLPTHLERRSRFPRQAATIEDQGSSRQEHHARGPPCNSVAMASPTRGARDWGARPEQPFRCIPRRLLPFRRIPLPQIRAEARFARRRLRREAMRPSDAEPLGPVPARTWPPVSAAAPGSTRGLSKTAALWTIAVRAASAMCPPHVSADIQLADTHAATLPPRTPCFPCAGSFYCLQRGSAFHYWTTAFSPVAKAAICAPTIARGARRHLRQVSQGLYQARCLRDQ